jgi:hypothetical protein
MARRREDGGSMARSGVVKKVRVSGSFGLRKNRYEVGGLMMYVYGVAALGTGSKYMVRSSKR